MIMACLLPRSSLVKKTPMSAEVTINGDETYLSLDAKGKK
jgi:hypothetical protein